MESVCDFSPLISLLAFIKVLGNLFICPTCNQQNCPFYQGLPRTSLVQIIQSCENKTPSIKCLLCVSLCAPHNSLLEDAGNWGREKLSKLLKIAQPVKSLEWASLQAVWPQSCVLACNSTWTLPLVGSASLAVWHPPHQKEKSRILPLFSLSFLDRSVALGLWCPHPTSPPHSPRHHLLCPGLACSPQDGGPSSSMPHFPTPSPCHTRVCTHTHKGHSLVFHSPICPPSLPSFVHTLFPSPALFGHGHCFLVIPCTRVQHAEHSPANHSG